METLAVIKALPAEYMEGKTGLLINIGLLVVLALSMVLAVVKALSALKDEVAKLVKPSKDRTCYNNDLVQGGLISDSVKAILKDMEGDRVLLADYHNGDISTGGRSMLKVTVTHEEIASASVGTVAQDIQAQTAALWAQWNKLLAANTPVLVPDTQALKEEIPSLYLFVAMQHNVKSIYLFPMFTPSGVLDGVGVLEYCREVRELSSDEIRMIGARFSAIEGLLMLAKHD